MQAVILSAGESTRFEPYRYFDHKSLVKILGKPIIIHTLESVRNSGIKNIIIVVSQKTGIKDLVGDGKKFGVNITYVIQKKPTGGGNGLLLAEKYIKGDFFLLNASRIDFSEFKDQMIRKKTSKDKAILLAKEEKELNKFGVLKINKDRVIDLIEKPQKGEEPSNLRLIGIYLFSKDFLTTLEETADEHYRLESAISTLVKKEQVRFIKTRQNCPSLKYAWDLLKVKDYLLEKSKEVQGKNISISKSAEIIGKVIIEDEVVIMEGARIKGPCFIGRNTMIGNNVILRGNVDIEENCVIGANMEIKNSLIMEGVKVHSGFIGDSVIGENCRIGVGFSTANVRLDRKTVKSLIKEKKVDSGLKFLGTMIGRNTKIGINVSTMPGVSIGSNSIIGPSTVVLNNVADNTKYYTKFKEVVIKMKNPKIVLFDIDYTLFDTSIFKKTIIRRIKEKIGKRKKLENIIEDIFISSRRKIGYFDPKHFISEINSKFGVNLPLSFFDKVLNENSLFKNLYDDVEEVLKDISKDKSLTIGIFSGGDIKFQKSKFESIKNLIHKDHIHIFLNKEHQVKRVIEKYKNKKIFIIDDWLSILEQAKKTDKNVVTIWIKRKGNEFQQKNGAKFVPDYTISDLRKIPQIIKEN